MAFTHIRIGADVRTADGDKVGEVKEVSASAFKVDAWMKPDYWLSRDAVLRETTLADVGGTVHLSFTKDKLDQHKLEHAA